MKLCRFLKTNEIYASKAYWCRFRKNGWMKQGVGDACSCQGNCEKCIKPKCKLPEWFENKDNNKIY